MKTKALCFAKLYEGVDLQQRIKIHIFGVVNSKPYEL